MDNAKNFFDRFYHFRARLLDRRTGGIAVDSRRETRYSVLGAEAVQSSDYRCLKRMFRSINPRKTDVLVDVGCGEGRVLTWLYAKHFPGKLIGIELNADAATVARQRTADCKNLEILQGSVLDAHEAIAEATVFYLFNPFRGGVFNKFVKLLERECTHPVTLLYLFDYYSGLLEDRPGWEKLREENITRRGTEPAHGTVWRFTPAALRKPEENKQ